MGEEYVNRLYRGVRRNLSRPFRFICYTDRLDSSSWSEPDIEVFAMDVPDWRWNLRKMILYKPNNGLTGRVLAFDLDIVITGSLDDIAAYDGTFATCEAAYRPGRAGGSLIGFQSGWGYEELYRPLEVDYKGVERMTHGSERKYLNGKLTKRMDFWQRLYKGQIVSYKVDCKKGLPDEARVVRFHGRPRPHQVEDEWVKRNWI
jgi:hypothetical protein